MEMKTLGSFLAALRKANGMTQKQLAEKLNVSDKAVSRWERDESAPDLTLIPVIAEIFGITSDELLRGERAAPGSDPERAAGKTEKQLRRLLKDAQTKFRIHSSISLCIIALGLIAAMICNFAFLRSRLAFLVGSIFYVVAAMCQIIFLIQSHAALDDDSFADTELDNCRLVFFRISAAVFSVLLTIILASVPFLFIDDAYMGISFGSWLLYGTIFAAVGILISFVLRNLIFLSLIRKGRLQVNESLHTQAKRKMKLFRSYLCVAAALLLIQLLLNEVSFVPGIRFDNWDDFKTFMETPRTSFSGTSHVEQAAVPVPDSAITYYDEFGNEITEEEALTEEVIVNGEVLCSYVRRNQTVFRIIYPGTEDRLPVTVYTADHLAQEAQLKQLFHICYLTLYLIAGAWFIHRYYKKKG